MLAETLRSEVRRLHNEYGFSYSKIVAETGIVRPTLMSFLNGKFNLNMENLEALGEYIGLGFVHDIDADEDVISTSKLSTVLKEEFRSRKSEGVTYSKMAKEAGISLPTLMSFLKGKFNFNMKNLQKVLNYFNYKPVVKWALPRPTESIVSDSEEVLEPPVISSEVVPEVDLNTNVSVPEPPNVATNAPVPEQ